MPETDFSSYASIGVLILTAVTATAAVLVAASLIGPKKRHGATKDGTYESGMPVMHDSRRRFNIRFYIVAMLFLLFDVEVAFLWPWALVYHAGATAGYRVPTDGAAEAGPGFLLLAMGLFFSILVLGLLYEWKKGAFRWD